MSKEANRSFPKISDDDVLDYLVLEAVATKVFKQDEELKKKQEREEWKKDKEGFKERLAGATAP